MQTIQREDAVIVQSEAPASAAVIWLHGLGADGFDFVPVVPELGIDDLPLRFVFPHAPMRPVTINGGQRMRAWYDVLDLNSADRQDAKGICDSERRVRDYIRAENEAGIASQRIVIAGFSQGGAITLHTSLRYPEQLAGILALSTYVPLHDRLPAEALEANRQTPIMMCHGTYDPVLPIALGNASRDGLRTMGYSVAWHEYPMQHAVCAEEITAIGNWLRQRLA